MAPGYQRFVDVYGHPIYYAIIYTKPTDTSAGKIIANGVTYSNTCSLLYYCLCTADCFYSDNKPKTNKFDLMTAPTSCNSPYQCRTYSDGTSACIDPSSVCTDTDGGKDYYNKGTASNGYVSYSDFCQDAKLNEYYCEYVFDGFSWKKELNSEHIYCPGSGEMCSNGKCININTCSDTDNGIDIYNKGSVTKGGSTSNDVCLSATRVQEFYCDANNNIKFTNQDCPSGYICEDGRCREVSCTDTDNGLTVTLPGKTSNETQIKYDICIDSTKIREYSCNTDRTIKEAILSCPDGYLCSTWFGSESSPAFCGYCIGPSAPDLYTQRTTSNSSGYSFTDHCLSESDVRAIRKGYCDQFIVRSVDTTCPENYKCDNGRCIPLSLCSDTDGNDKNIVGTVSNTTHSFTDKCVNSTHVTEYTCSGNVIISTNLSCDNGACLQDSSGGRCVYNQCVDTDGGIQLTVYGEAKKDNIIMKDSCYNLFYINESYCSNGNPTSSLYDCIASDMICQSGKCRHLGFGECVDTDGGKILDVYGETADKDFAYFDSCVNATHIAESFCSQSATYEVFYCGENKLCYNGRCVANTQCVDLDLGPNSIYFKSQAAKGSTIITDYCPIEGGTFVKEAICSNDNPIFVDLNCPANHICSGGKCVSTQNQCIDNDNGKVKTQASFSINSTNRLDDVCHNINTVNETYCDGSIIKVEQMVCDSNQICLNGQCVLGQQCTRNDDQKRTTNGTVTLQDYCIDERFLNYTYCGSDNRVLTMKKECPTNHVCDSTKRECVPKNRCIDSDTDAENPSMVSGTTSNGTETKSDTCINERILQEYYCNDESNAIFSEYISCPEDYFCVNGACKKSFCEDSDAGSSDPLVEAGYAENLTERIEDKCVQSDLRKIDEATCLGNKLIYKRYSCPEGLLCNNGKCEQSSYATDMCIDTDDGENEFKKGNTYGIKKEGDIVNENGDYCINENSLREYYCRSSTSVEVLDKIINCPQNYICRQGECQVLSCGENDNGIDENEQGFTSLYAGSDELTITRQTDYCINDFVLKEFYCDETELQVKSQNIDCRNQNMLCIEGRCINCYDSDGDSPYTDGYVKTAGVIKHDVCVEIVNPDGTRRAKVTEYLCDGNNIASKEYTGAVGTYCGTAPPGSAAPPGSTTYMVSPNNCIQLTDVNGRTIVYYNNIVYKDHCAPNEISVIKYSCDPITSSVIRSEQPCPPNTRCPYTLDFSYFTCNPIAKTCVDSDGNSPGTLGYVKVTENGLITFYNDQCSNDGTNRILEATCDGNNLRYIIYDCENNCVTDASGRAICNIKNINNPALTNPIIPNVPNSLSICFPIIILSVLFSLVVVYIVSKGLGMTQLEMIVRNEFIELGNSLIQFILILGIFNITSNFVLPNNSNFVNFAVFTLDQINFHYTVIYDIVVENYANMVKLFTFSYDYSNARFGFVSNWNSLTPLSGLMPVAEGIISLSNQLLLLMAFNSSIKFLLIILQGFGLFLLAFGFMLKVVPFTRSIGTMLISLFISMQIFLPLGVYFFQFLMMDYISNSIRTVGAYIDVVERSGARVPPVANPPGYGTVCNQGIQVFTFIGEVNWANIICPPLQPWVPYPLCKWIVTLFYVSVQYAFTNAMSVALNNYISQAAQGDFRLLYLDKLKELMDVVLYSSIATLVTYLIVLFMIISAARSISIALSGDVTLYGITRII
ncbi:MAG: ABC transporter permease [Candidatus Micrarchaeota archaeon]|nr:ABC transporter permease [Candidatus Micrarchaeota archaeon]